MRKKIWRMLSCFILVFILVFDSSGLSGIGKITGTVKAAGPDYKLYVGSKVLGSQENMKDLWYTTNSIEIDVLDSTQGNPSAPGAGFTIKWLSGNTDVLKIDTTAAAYKQKFTIVGTGTTVITAELTETSTGIITPISCAITVPLEVDKLKPSDTGFYQINDLGGGDLKTSEKVMVLGGGPGGKKTTQEVKLMYGIKSTPGSLTWTSSNDSIATINNDNNPPTVTAKQAGVATITVTPLGGNSSDPVSFLVLVQPRFKNSAYQSGDENNNFTGYTYGLTVPPKDAKVGMRFGTDFVKLDSLDITAFTEDNQPTNDVTMRVDGKNLVIDSIKAGKYNVGVMPKLTGKVVDTELARLNLMTFLKMNVPIDYPKAIYVNKGETFEFEHGTNIQNWDHFDYKEVKGLNDDTAVDAGSALIDNAKLKASGIIVPQKTGTTYVKATMKTNVEHLYYLYDENGAAQKDFTIQVTITDGIKLNTTTKTIPEKDSFELIAMTESGNQITWESSDTKVATVEGTGKKATVTGLKTGTTVITVKQKIDGTTKYDKCYVTVTKSVDGVVVSPSNLLLEIKQEALITANITPDDIVADKISWVSMDEKIVKVKNSTSKSATVEAVASGTTYVVAVSTDNVRLGMCKVTVDEKLSGLKLSESTVTKKMSDKTHQLKAELSPGSVQEAKLKWTTSDPSVATVNQQGLVTFVKPGTATISVMSTRYPDIESASCKINIETPVSGVTLDANEKMLYVGGKEKLTAKVMPESATNKGIVWTSASPSVATISEDGTITGVSVGKTTITVRTADGGHVASCNVEVNEKASDIKLSAQNVTINKGETTEIKYTITPASANEVNLTWTSMNPSVATVTKDGKITGVSAGTSVIFVKTASGQVAYANVTVVEKITGMTINATKKTINKGATFKLIASTVPKTPNTAINSGVIFSSSDPAVATVTAAGVVKGVKGGTAIITVKSKTGNYTQFCVVTVKEIVSGIKMNKTTAKIGVKKTVQLKATVTNTASTNKKVRWKSSNTKVATVNSSGLVTGRKEGTCTITATAQDGSNKSASCKVTVIRPATSIRLSKSIVTMKVGKNYKLKATINPSTTTYRTATWSSDNPEVVRVSAGGTLTALKTGTANIKAVTKDGTKKAAYCFVSVIADTPATSITLSQQDLLLSAGESITLRKVVQPANTTDSVTWSSDNSKVATVSSTSGKVRAVRPGVANITALTSSGKNVKCKVTVVGLNAKSITLEQYTTYQLRVQGATSGIAWDSSNPSVATVSTSGLVTSRSPGTATIVADVNGVPVSCKVTVTKIR